MVGCVDGDNVVRGEIASEKGKEPKINAWDEAIGTYRALDLCTACGFGEWKFTIPWLGKWIRDQVSQERQKVMQHIVGQGVGFQQSKIKIVQIWIPR